MSTHSTSNGQTTFPISKALSSQSSRQVSGSISKMPLDNMNPDELFVKHSISEIKLIQQRLRADADAKQEELRLMVGERYRDLLQASTSIISIAKSSSLVIHALKETKVAILAEEVPSIPKLASVQRNEDTHLQALQILAAHMKLLLDVPEHLWRLLEKKKYFTAAWLFLLSRVVHRALVREDEREEETWRSQGIDVVEQFPLVQRQWEVVSQFRSQIIHRAVLSLREYTTSSEGVCATLLALHLLDSRPFAETLTTLLEQRAKALQLILSKTSEKPHSLVSISTRQTKGLPPDKSLSYQRSIKEVKHSILLALDSIGRTVKTCQDVFRDQQSSPSLIRSVLEFIQNGSSRISLPPELQLTTDLLLTNLPSSAHFIMLPQNLKSYKPYVDLNSSSSSISTQQLSQQVREWFQNSAKTLQLSVEAWVRDLRSVKQVWSIRSAVRNWLQTSIGLDSLHDAQLNIIFDDIFRERIVEIWKSTLSDAESTFQDRLASAVFSSGKETSLHSDVCFTGLLFQAPPLPTVSQSGVGSADSSFQKYRSNLQRQLLCRTSLLEDVLHTLEDCARTLQDDLTQVLRGDDDDTSTLVHQLRRAYHPETQRLCTNVLKNLSSVVDEISSKAQLNVDALVFVCHLAEALSSTSPFASYLCRDSVIATEFRTNTQGLYNSIVDCWRNYTVPGIISRHKLALSPVRKSQTCASASSALVESLLSLAQAIQSLGFTLDSSRQLDLSHQTTHLFISQLVTISEGWDQDIQTLHDLAFLQKVCEIWEVQRDWSDIRKSIDFKIAGIRRNIGALDEVPDGSTLGSRVAEHLSRTQILLAAVLPPSSSHAVISGNRVSSEKLSAFLPLGLPSLDQEYHPALDLVKPSARFGLLLVS